MNNEPTHPWAVAPTDHAAQAPRPAGPAAAEMKVATPKASAETSRAFVRKIWSAAASAQKAGGERVRRWVRDRFESLADELHDEIPGWHKLEGVRFVPDMVDGWADTAEGGKSRTRAEAIVGRVLGVDLAGRLDFAGLAVSWLDGRAKLTGAEPRTVKGWAQVGRYGPDDAAGVLIVTASLELAALASLATGLPAWAWVSGKPKEPWAGVRLGCEGPGSFGDQPHQVRAVVVLGKLGDEENLQAAVDRLAEKHELPLVYLRTLGDIPKGTSLESVGESIVQGVDFSRARVSERAAGDVPHGGTSSNRGSPRGGAGGGGRGGDGWTSKVDWNSDGDGRPAMAWLPLDVAREYLWDQCRLDGQRVFGLKYWADEWWSYRGNCWRRLSAVELGGAVQVWLARFATVKQRKNRTVLVDMLATPDMVAQVLTSLKSECFVRKADGVSVLPFWLAPDLGDDGRPLWGRSVRIFENAAIGDRPDPASLVAYANGVWDRRATLKARRVVMLPHDAQLFSSSVLPYRLRVDELQAYLDGGDERELVASAGPLFWEWLTSSCSPDPETSEDGCSEVEPDWAKVESLQMAIADTASGERTREVIFFLIGRKRSGKNTAFGVMKIAVGEDNCCAFQMQNFEDRFAMWPLVGKRAALMDEVEPGKYADTRSIVGTLKTWSGNGEFQVRNLHKEGLSVQMTARLWMAANSPPTELRDRSGAFASRLHFIPFTRTFFDRERPEFKHGMIQQAEAIGLWCAIGMIKLMRLGSKAIPMCADGVDMQRSFARVSASYETFSGECLLKRSDAMMSFQSLYDLYARWCEHEGFAPDHKPRFGEEIKLHVPGYKRIQISVDNTGIPVGPKNPYKTARREWWVRGCEMRTDLPDEIKYKPRLEHDGHDGGMSRHLD